MYEMISLVLFIFSIIGAAYFKGKRDIKKNQQIKKCTEDLRKYQNVYEQKKNLDKNYQHSGDGAFTNFLRKKGKFRDRPKK